MDATVRPGEDAPSSTTPDANEATSEAGPDAEAGVSPLAGDASQDGGLPVEAGFFADGGACSVTDDIAPAIETTLVLDAVPVAAGGAIVSGTYINSSTIAYTSDANCCYLDNVNCSNGLGGSSTLIVTARSSTSGVIEIAGHACSATSSCGTLCYTVSGTMLSVLPTSELSLDPDCTAIGDASLPSFAFTATSSQFTLYESDSCTSSNDVCNVTLLATYTKR